MAHNDEQQHGGSGVWRELGFRHNPYDARPLLPTPEHNELLVGREEELVTFSTILDSGNQGVCVISGRPGVGKTSFLNVQQYRSATGLGTFGPKLLTAEQLCTIRPGDVASTIARRVVEMLIKSVETDCFATGRAVPPETKKISKWIRSGGTGSGYDIGITIMAVGANFGRSTELPSVSEASFEALCDAIRAIISEVVCILDYDGAFMPLDNLENLDDDELSDLLISFRDTLFDVPGVWWVLIGQSGLGSLIQTLDPRVWERVAGSGIELKALELDALHEAIERRVQQFSSGENRRSPLPKPIHATLYEASQGELRYTLKKSTDICIAVIADFRKRVIKVAEERGMDDGQAIANEIAASLVDDQIPTELAESTLFKLVELEFEQLGLSSRERRAFAKIGSKGEVRPKDYEFMGFNSGQALQSTILSKFHPHLLYRRQEGKPVYYGLRGVALLAAKFGLLDESSATEAESASEEDDEALFDD